MKRFIVGLMLCGFVLSSSAAADDELKLTKEEQELVDLTNQERAKEKLPPVKVNSLLMKVARDHSALMAKTGILAHNIIDGKEAKKKTPDNAQKQAIDLGYKGETVDNLCKGFSPDGAMKHWMRSPGHRPWIVDDKAEEIGVGLVLDPKGKSYFYMAQVFGRPAKK